MVDMARTEKEMSEGMPEYIPPVYPGGLCISLSHNELDKLGLEPNCEVGDLMHAMVMAKVTNISKGEDSCRIEMQIVDIEMLEDENHEEPNKYRPGNRYK